MKRGLRIKKSFLYRMVIYFVFMVVIPILCSWLIYESMLRFHYAKNELKIQQINLENSLSLFNTSIGTASNVFTALEGDWDLTYYLDYKHEKSNMPYRSFQNVKMFCDEMYMMTPYLTSIKIYSDSLHVIYAEPFVHLEDFSLDGDIREAVDNARFQENVWYAKIIEHEVFPVIYGYRKLYAHDYRTVIGYIEIQLSSQLLADYFELLSVFFNDSYSVLDLYKENQLVYLTSSEEKETVFVESEKSGYEFSLLKNKSWNYIEIPELDLYVVRSGILLNSDTLISKNAPSIFISIIFVLLMVLFVIFFLNTLALSRRIRDFASFIIQSNPDQLHPFYPKVSSANKEDEINFLIDTYNMLIKDKNSLISQIQKNELFMQSARYQVLQGQIHPHFIYGTLETIRMTALQNQDKEAASMIFSLSALIRYSLSISSQAVTLKEEVEMAEHYMKIQKIRIGDRMDYSCRVEGKLLGLELPFFVLQPILENAIGYGVLQTLEQCIITVEAYEEGNQIILRVSNTGIPITSKRLQEVNGLLSGRIAWEDFQGNNTGLALYNIKERIGIYFKGRATIQMSCEDNKTATIITINKR